MKSIRCFIAIELMADVQKSLAEVQESLASDMSDRSVRWVEPANIHLTLKFLGDIDPADVKQIGDCLEDIATTTKPFVLHLGKLGCFPNPRKPRVIWIGVDRDVEPLADLQKQVEAGLEELGWPAESRRYHPHLTLGRVKDSRKVVEARYPWGKIQAESEQQVREICLVKSDLRPTGAVYTVLRRAGFAPV